MTGRTKVVSALPTGAGSALGVLRAAGGSEIELSLGRRRLAWLAVVEVRLFRLFQSVSNRSETDKLLIKLSKLPAVSLFQRFRGVATPNFNLTARLQFKLRGHHPRKTLKQRNRQRFPMKFQYLVCFTPF